MKIHTIDLGFLQLDHSIAAFVVETAEGPALVECGPHATFPALEKGLADLGYKPADIRRVFLSHIHFDHAGAAWAFARAGATIYVHPKGLPHLAAPEKLYNSARQIYKEQMDTLWGEMNPIPESQLYAPAHGESFDLGGIRFTAWHTPGHAVHHIAWQCETSDAPPVVFTGDVGGVRIGADQPVFPPCPPPDIHVEDWLDSIALLRSLPAQTFYLTHFGAISDTSSHLDELSERLMAWAQWMKPYAEAQTPPEEIVPLFENYVAAEMAAAGVDAEGRQKYQAANPAFMSVAGLLRYWNKKNRPA